jgi:DNA-binding CsgD family transcriptional regulator/tetratricopeptide (TPR) repeat protein
MRVTHVARRPAISSILVGRTQQLEELLAAAVAPAILLIEGEAGVGKSRLVAELLARPQLSTRRLLVGHCHAVRESFPFGPVLEALQELPRPPRTQDLSPVTGALRAWLPEGGDWLPPAVEQISDPRAAHHRVLRALRSLLSALGPTVLVLEDAHWCDPGTAELLALVVADMPPSLTLVVTYRPDQLPAGLLPSTLTSRPPLGVSHLSVPLDRLDRDQVGELATSLADQEVPAAIVTYVHERTSGLPFAVEELVRLLQRRRDADAQHRWPLPKASELSVPSAVAQFVVEQVGDLSADARVIVQTAAILGPGATLREVAAVADVAQDRVLAALNEARAIGVLQDTDHDRVTFRHLLASDAVQASIPSLAALHLHHRAVEMLESLQPRPADRLAHHCKAAGLIHRYVEEAELAADQAQAAGNPAAAARFLLDALAVETTPLDDRARIAAKAGWTALYGLAHHDAIPMVERLLAEPLDDPARGELHLVQALLMLQAGDTTVADSHLLAAAPHLDHRPDLKAKCLHYLSLPWLGERPLSDHMRWQAQVEALMAELGPEQQEYLRSQSAVSLVETGDPRGWDVAHCVLVDRDASIAQQRADMLAAANLAQIACRHGEVQQAETFVARALQLAHQMDDGWLRGTFAVIHLLLDWHSGHWDGLAERTEALLEETADVPPDQVDVALVHGLLLLARGELDQARRSLTTAQALAEAIGALPLAGAAGGGLARLALAAGDTESALTALDAPLARLRRKGVWVWAADLCPVAVATLLAAEQPDAAAQLVAEFAQGLEDRHAPAAFAALAWCQGLLAAADQEPGAARMLAAAGDQWLAIGRPYEQALVTEVLGQQFVASDPDGARDVWVTALTVYSQLGASWEISRLCALMRRHGIDPPYPWRGGPRSYAHVLSPREAEVVRLAAEGRTNREIAQTLFLSPRTIEGHVARALRKLGVQTRDQLAQALEG